MRTMLLILLPLLVGACGPASATIIPLSEITDPGTGSDPDPDTESDTQTEPAKVVQAWEGVRNFDFGNCQEPVDEQGVRITTGPQVEACADCDYVFEVTMLQDRVCGIDLQNPAWRGVSVRGQRATLYFITQDRHGNWVADERDAARVSQDAEGLFFEYAYEGNAGWGRDYAVEAYALLIEK